MPGKYFRKSVDSHLMPVDIQRITSCVGHSWRRTMLTIIAGGLVVGLLTAAAVVVMCCLVVMVAEKRAK